jgi:hypothetical protein
MNFTFGFITSGNNDTYLNIIIDSIEFLKIPQYEIIIVGNSNVDRLNTKVIPFDETIKKSWITRKKNIITENANYDNIVYSHDYIIFEPDWYYGYLKFGDNFNISMNKILNMDYTRFRDWVLWPHNNTITDSIVSKNRQCVIPYNITHLSKYMYISGSYWVAKKHVMQEFKLNESLGWGDGEDVNWSIQVRNKYDFSINTNSTVRCLKYKDIQFNIADSDTITKLMNVV